MVSRLQAVATAPAHLHEEYIYVGIDVGKNSHVAAFLSQSLLRKYRRYRACPTQIVKQSRSSYEDLVNTMLLYAPLDRCRVIVERTGHYHHAIKEYLQERGVAVYEIHVDSRPSKIKTDKRDAQNLANLLYNQVELGVQLADDEQIAHHVLPATREAALLRPMMRHYHELVRGVAARKNKLTSICDELFPEFGQAIKNTTCDYALRVRGQFPTAADIAAASLDDLKACRSRKGPPSNKVIMTLHQLAKRSIGISDIQRKTALCLEQKQLIMEISMMQNHIAELELCIEPIVQQSRQGQILMSIPTIGTMTAATLMANIGTIANFDSPGKLRGYCGWSPVIRASGTTLDSRILTKGGNRLLRHTTYLIGWHVISNDTVWKEIYDRMVPLKCPYDMGLKRYRGKNKVVGRIIGQVIGVIWKLLRDDYDLLAALPEGAAAPDPRLYSREIHQAGRIF